MKKILTEFEAKKILKGYGIPIPREGLANDVGEAVKIAKDIGYPVVLKLISPDILHRSDAKGIMIDLNSEKDVREGYREIIENSKKFKKDARIEGMLVQKYMPQGKEVIVGIIRDEHFGPALMFGLGGIFVEVLKDVSFRVAPIDGKEALKMIREIKAFSILEGVRGEKPADINGIIDVITKVSKLAMEMKEILEMDINPLFVYEKGVVAIDSRMILEA